MKNKFIIGSFIVIVYGLMLVNIFKTDKEVSYSERRHLAKAPSYSTKTLLNGDLFESYEKYMLDQFVLRDEFRGLKSLTRFNIFNQKDNNDIYIVNEGIYKMEYPLNEKAIVNAANKFNEVYEKYLQGMNVNYAIIPDKNYFVASDNGYLSMDYERLITLMKTNLSTMKYIDVFHSLEIEDYYNTDIHWRQEKIVDVANMILSEMGIELKEKAEPYKEKELYPFYGSYYGQASLGGKPDTLVYLTNKTIDEALVYDHNEKTYSNIYMEDKFGTIDSYDIFLSGARPILTITNANSSSNKELIIFRDSYGSSIAPLLLEGYSKIILIDLRYIMTDLLGEYVEFSEDQDVLFLYNTLILNNSYMLK